MPPLQLITRRRAPGGARRRQSAAIPTFAPAGRRSPCPIAMISRRPARLRRPPPPLSTPFTAAITACSGQESESTPPRKPTAATPSCRTVALCFRSLPAEKRLGRRARFYDGHPLPGPRRSPGTPSSS